MRILFAIIALALPIQAAPPANDSFANAGILSGEYTTVNGTLVEATKELNEPAGGGVNSVWYKWTSPAYGIAEFGTLFADTLGGNQQIEVFVGTGLNNLALLTSDADGNEPRINLNVGAGVTYHIRLSNSQYNSAPATTFSAYVDLDTSGFEQALFKGTTYSNDNFNQAQAVSGNLIKVIGYPAAATREAGEPDETGSATIWWKWVAPSSGKTIFSSAGSEVGYKGNIMTIATGSRVSDLSYTSQIGDYDIERAVDTKKGTTYYIALGKYGRNNLSYILTVDHTSDGGKSSGTGFKARFLTLPRDLLDESLIKGEFTASGITNYSLRFDETRFYIENFKIVKSGKGYKWQFNLGKKTFSVSPWKANVVMTGYAKKKAVSKVSKSFRLW